MSTFDLPVAPTIVSSAGLQGNTGLFASPLIASAQTVDRGGDKWVFSYTYSNLQGANRALMLSLLARLRGQANRLRVPVYDNPARGNYGGTPLVDGATQTGYSLNIKGLSTGVAGWGANGDYFSVAVNGEHELHMLTDDVDSDGSGLATLVFEPKLRASPADNAVVFVEDGVLSKPRGIFLLTDADRGWSSARGRSGAISALTLSLVEDVFATQ